MKKMKMFRVTALDSEGDEFSAKETFVAAPTYSKVAFVLDDIIASYPAEEREEISGLRLLDRGTCFVDFSEAAIVDIKVTKRQLKVAQS